MKMGVTLFLTLMMTTGLVNAGGGSASATALWSCPVRMLPEYKAKESGSADAGEGVTYLYMGGKDLHSGYDASADFTAPLDGRRGWYDSALRLGPLKENNGFVQIEISRWERFHYEQHVAVAWALPHASVVEYRDTGFMLADGVAHRLGISVRNGLLRLTVDGRVVCSTRASYFVDSSERKYFQVRTETSVVGSNGAARVSNLRLKRDSDVIELPYRTDCILHRYGVFWEYRGAAGIVARGAFYPNESTFFTGIDPSKHCRI
jgi:hypothetical protein